MKFKNITESKRNQIYLRILLGKPYNDILNCLCPYQQNKMLDSINRYRMFEKIDMVASHRAQVSGLTKTTCAQLNSIYRDARGDR